MAQLRADLLRAEQANERMRQAKHDIQAQLQAMAGWGQSACCVWAAAPAWPSCVQWQLAAASWRGSIDCTATF